MFSEPIPVELTNKTVQSFLFKILPRAPVVNDLSL